MTLKVNCPQCDRLVAWSEDSKFRPFCSERCRLIDLGAWASEEYSVPVAESDLSLEMELEASYSSEN
ncbi:MAG: DNA gyrase inhibitor YacG [Gammaproteobacteria bacterium]|nr:DNA gyrase inhibitor YacG [Gammaproteobacteria bacterium]MDH5730788.1 DNA gyrase inhibitor YacG [Gammaproteobacteria bacterium]